MNNFLCFVHIEKSGGITLHNMLHRNFFAYVSPDPSYSNYFSGKQLSKTNHLFFNYLKGVGGHKVGSFLNYEEALNKDVFYFSFVRNPINRYISHLNWQKHVMKIDWSINEFLSKKEFNNFQCYRICGERNFIKAKKEIDNKFSFVGMLENYDESLLILKNILKNDFNPYYEKSNEKNYGDKKISFDELTEEEKIIVKENNSEDIKLYDYIKNEVYPKYKEVTGIDAEAVKRFTSEVKKYKFSKFTILKRKISNQLMSKIIQPIFK